LNRRNDSEFLGESINFERTIYNAYIIPKLIASFVKNSTFIKYILFHLFRFGPCEKIASFAVGSMDMIYAGIIFEP